MADFPDIPIDVSAEDIENLVKNPIVVDSELDTTSTNPVENGAITNKLKRKANWDRSQAPITSESMEDAFLTAASGEDCIGYLKGSDTITPKLFFNFANDVLKKQLKFSIDEKNGELQAYERHEISDSDYGIFWSPWYILKYKEANGDYEHIGAFSSRSDLAEYPFEANKTYQFNLSVSDDDMYIEQGSFIGVYESIGSPLDNPRRLVFHRFLTNDGVCYSLNPEDATIEKFYVADQTFDPYSTLPQSGIAIAEAIKNISGGGSITGTNFVYAGTFNTVDSLRNYKFIKENTMYMFRISGELYNTLGYGCLPSSGAMCIGYYYVTTPGINQGLMYQTVLPDGYSYALNISNLQGVKHSIATSSYSSTGNNPVNGVAVAQALAPIYETLDGLEDLLAGI